MGIAQNALIVFTKCPEFGKVKTRIAREVGHQKAYQIYLELLESVKHLLEEMVGLNIPTYLYFTPKDQEVRIRLVFSMPNLLGLLRPHYVVQEGEDLGIRMMRAFREVVCQGYTNVIIIGSDIPALKPADILKAFQELETHEVVIGPSMDGGYYLLGIRTDTIEPLFDSIEWGTDRVFEQTLDKLNRLHLTYSILPTLYDIDTFEDYKRWKNLNLP